MPELPDRPDLDQLRRQARELLRAATRDEPSAVARLRAVSERVTLSAAQLAVAREYGYRSWPALKAEVERRRLMTQPARKSPSPGGDEQGPAGVPGERWSFGGVTAIKTSEGVLLPETVVVGAGHATLYASLTPGNSLPPRGQAALGPNSRSWPRQTGCRSAGLPVPVRPAHCGTTSGPASPGRRLARGWLPSWRGTGGRRRRVSPLRR